MRQWLVAGVIEPRSVSVLRPQSEAPVVVAFVQPPAGGTFNKVGRWRAARPLPALQR